MQKIITVLMPLLLASALMLTGFSLLHVGKNAVADLSISGTSATCSVNVCPDKNTDNVAVSVQLVCGTDVVAEWTGLSSTGPFSFSETVSVKKWKTYTMKTTCNRQRFGSWGVAKKLRPI